MDPAPLRALSKTLVILLALGSSGSEVMAQTDKSVIPEVKTPAAAPADNEPKPPTPSLSSAPPAPNFASSPTPENIAALKKAYGQMKSSLWSDAQATLCALIRVDPNNAMARRYLCYALIEQGEAKQALEQLDVLAQLPNPVGFDLYMKGLAFQLVAERSKAAEAFKQAVIMEPQSDVMRTKAIDAMQVVNKYDDASAICAEGYYNAKDPKVKDQYLSTFSEIQKAKAYLKDRMEAAAAAAGSSGQPPPPVPGLEPGPTEPGAKAGEQKDKTATVTETR